MYGDLCEEADADLMFAKPSDTANSSQNPKK